jgi:hypothetical protein
VRFGEVAGARLAVPAERLAAPAVRPLVPAVRPLGALDAVRFSLRRRVRLWGSPPRISGLRSSLIAQMIAHGSRDVELTAIGAAFFLHAADFPREQTFRGL